MTISATSFMPSTGENRLNTAGLQASQDATKSFAKLLDAAKHGKSKEEVRRSAEQLVAATFVTPLLKQVRESSQAVEPFAPTPAEKQFGALLDQRVADDLVHASNLPIVDRLVATIDPSRGGPNR